MVAPMAAALLLEPLSALMCFFGCVLVYLCIRWLSGISLIIGLKRYGAALLFSIAYVWSVELFFIQMGLQDLPFQGNHLLVIVAILSYANDAVLHGVRHVLPWMLLMLASAMLVLLLTQRLFASVV